MTDFSNITVIIHSDIIANKIVRYEGLWSTPDIAPSNMHLSNITDFEKFIFTTSEPHPEMGDTTLANIGKLAIMSAI